MKQIKPDCLSCAESVCDECGPSGYEGLTLPVLPDDDKDFTPDLARAIIAKYQQIIAALATPPAPQPTLALIEELTAALKASTVALDDWVNVYAPDMCDEKRVAEAKARLNEGGTLWYIAVTQERNHAALASAKRFKGE